MAVPITIYKIDFLKAEMRFWVQNKVEVYAPSAHFTLAVFIFGTNWLTVCFTVATPGANTSCQLILLKITFKIHAKKV